MFSTIILTIWIASESLTSKVIWNFILLRVSLSGTVLYKLHNNSWPADIIQVLSDSYLIHDRPLTILFISSYMKYNNFKFLKILCWSISLLLNLINLFFAALYCQVSEALIRLSKLRDASWKFIKILFFIWNNLYDRTIYWKIRMKPKTFE